jgi:putative flippase GtrA
MTIVTNKHEWGRFLKFSFVGVTGTIVDFGVMNLLTLLLQLAPIWAQVISFTVAVVNNFLWNRYWTYPESRSKNIQKQLLQFFLINIVGILIRTLIFSPLNNAFLKLFEQTKRESAC